MAEHDGERSEVLVIVDDEEMVLTSLNAFLALETDYEVKTFSQPAEALAYLKDNDSYTFFDKTGFLLKTGPTNTNVSDLQIAVIGKSRTPNL